MDYVKNLLRALMNSESKDSNAKLISKHLARVVENEWEKSADKADALYPDFKEKAIRLIQTMKESDDEIKITDGFRSAKKQQDLYSQGRTAPGKVVTNAQALQSYHNYGLAFDFIFNKYGYNPPVNILQFLVKEAEALGLVWGGSWQDSFHLEWHPQFTWEELEPYFK